MSEHSSKIVVGAAISVAGAGLTAAAVNHSRNEKHPPDDAPGRTAKHGDFGDYDVVGHAVTINRPRAELYAFWRDFPEQHYCARRHLLVSKCSASCHLTYRRRT